VSVIFFLISRCEFGTYQDKPYILCFNGYLFDDRENNKNEKNSSLGNVLFFSL
jgi:hypothetical protein